MQEMCLTVHAPAKINLVLEVLGQDNDYHQISSIVQAIDLCDTLSFRVNEEVSFKCSEASLESDNLVIEAAKLLKQVTKSHKGAQIELFKRIPSGVGLGGGSSDAAATLLTLNQLWQLKLSLSELVDLASRLGSDVPFFVYKGTCLVQGIGEKITPLPSLGSVWFVLLVPPLSKIPGKTTQMYSRLNASHFTRGQFVIAALPSLRQRKMIIPPLMFNVFEEVVLDAFPQLNKYRETFEDAGAPSVHLAGSGPALFTFVLEKEKADELLLRLRQRGLECYTAACLPGIRGWPI
jgi:4-diphosphocytidyl-2-C-methyl-D-erythritol kinase